MKKLIVLSTLVGLPFTLKAQLDAETFKKIQTAVKSHSQNLDNTVRFLTENCGGFDNPEI